MPECVGLMVILCVCGYFTYTPWSDQRTEYIAKQDTCGKQQIHTYSVEPCLSRLFTICINIKRHPTQIVYDQQTHTYAAAALQP